MTELLNAAEMREVERLAMENGAVTGLALMERAGAAVVEAVLEQWPDLAQGARRALVLCGPGNNGGDGFVIARLLAERGWTAEVVLFGDPDRLPPDARANADRWRALGPIQGATTWCAAPREAQNDGFDLFVDALFGTGLGRPLPDEVEGLRGFADHAAGNGLRRVAVDIPSGLCADSGRVLRSEQMPSTDDQPVFRADLTVSFHRAKLGHLLDEGPAACGHLVVRDIGLTEATAPGAQCARQVGPPVPARIAKLSGHKYGHGHAVILSGQPGKGGAARLAARGALRVGAGLVSVACPQRAVPEHAAQLNAIMVKGLDGTPGLAEMLEDTRYNAICLGPGLGLGLATADLVMTAVKARRAVVLDADALSRFQRNPALLFDLLHEACVLTPHDGEFARLFPDLADDLAKAPERGPAYSRVDAARAAAARAGCAVLLKGHDTVIATPDGQATVHSAAYERAAPWLATAGSGDVLAGMICGLMARGLTAREAAEAATWLHVEAARSFGPGLIAEDLPEQLPKVFGTLGL